MVAEVVANFQTHKGEESVDPEKYGVPGGVRTPIRHVARQLRKINFKYSDLQGAATAC